jgi:hypothetical protein
LPAFLGPRRFIARFGRNPANLFNAGKPQFLSLEASRVGSAAGCPLTMAATLVFGDT